MERKSWTVEVHANQHDVTLDWTYWSGRREVAVDRRAVSKSTVPMRWRSKQAFEISGHPAVVLTKPARRFSSKFVISLEVDGKVVQPDPGKSMWEA